MIVTLFVVFAVASSVFGECPTPPIAPANADIAKIAGRWYEIARPTHVSENGLTCVTCNVTPRKDRDFNITNLGTKPDGSMAFEYAIAIRTASQSLLHLKPIAIQIPFAIPFNIAATDYNNYLAAYTCLHDVKHGWILSRTNSMSDTKLTELSNLLTTKYGVSLNETEFTSHKDCEYWPVP